MKQVRCHSCCILFQPKNKGYNARYCSDKCKRRNQRARLKIKNPEQIINARKRSYIQTKNHPDRLAAHRKRGTSHRRIVREWLAQYKLERGCIDCGYKKHSAALQLDHEGVKSISISDARSSILRLQNEIIAGQCKVRCANCHSIKTWERKQKIGRGCDGE